jgi:hypothetical protein
MQDLGNAIAGIETLHGINADRCNLVKLRPKYKQPPAAWQAVLVAS